MSTPANHWAIIQSLKHIKKNDIKGDIVECGVWRGGNLILFKKIINTLNLKRKYLHSIHFRECLCQAKMIMI